MKKIALVKQQCGTRVELENESVRSSKTPINKSLASPSAARVAQKFIRDERALGAALHPAFHG